MSDEPTGLLAPHHSFDTATMGIITCRRCGKWYTLNSAWQAAVDPCLDGQPTGVTEEQAKAKVEWMMRLIMSYEND
jgi:hypothetical protein